MITLLYWPVRGHVRSAYLEELSLVACECTADPQVQLLSSIHRHGLVLIRPSQRVHRLLDVSVGDRAEFGSKYRLSRKEKT